MHLFGYEKQKNVFLTHNWIDIMPFKAKHEDLIVIEC